MSASYPLITTVVVSLGSAFILGYIAKALKLPAIFGYMLAGILIGPYTPGVVADTGLAMQLAEIGIILLMFGVGLHFSLKDLLSVKNIAIPGAIFQIFIATLIGYVFCLMMGLPPVQGIVFGFCLSVASTIVMVRTLEQRNLVDTQGGRIAIGWLIVEDIAIVMALVMLPVLAHAVVGQPEGGEVIKLDLLDIAGQLGMVLLKISVFAVFMVMFGRRLLPMLLVQIWKTKSRELMSLGTLSIALGFAYIAYVLFDASFALGAFLAGLVLNNSEIGHKAAEQSLPLRDAFSVIFFVSVGMLFDPKILIEQPMSVLAVLTIIVIGKSLAAIAIVLLFRQPMGVALLVAASLAQIGEFSFIFAGMARTLNLMPDYLYDLILSGALLSIAVNPFLFRYVVYLSDKLQKKEKAASMKLPL